ncbi:MAG: hypothetical protein JOZ87_02695 [Chloroflexi bacterium]|nr:hypothetical protein [Chloroflexota bacterium]
MIRRLLGCLSVCALLLALAPVAAADPLDVLGAYDPGSAGFNAMAVGLDGIAYLGSWGGSAQCPSLGVRLIDVHDPAAPAPIGSAAAYSGTTAEHVAAVHLATPIFSGNVLLAGIQRCRPGGAEQGGLAIWDVTDPANPAELALFVTGRRSLGVHEFTVRQQRDRWLAYLAVPNSEITEGSGDLRIVDFTDPRNPTQVLDWGARKDAGLPVGANGECLPYCRGMAPDAYLHSVALSPDGRTAYLSYWDLGVIILDVTEPSAPRMLGWFKEPLSDEGNTHSVALAHDGKLMLVADETEAPPWGGLRLVDIADPANPRQVATFETEDAASARRGEAYAYSIHNPLTDDRDQDRAYVAWYGDGVRLLNVADASQPLEIASWVPPRGGMIWNVAFLGDLLLAGDINNGLYILRR